MRQDDSTFDDSMDYPETKAQTSSRKESTTGHEGHAVAKVGTIEARPKRLS